VTQEMVQPEPVRGSFLAALALHAALAGAMIFSGWVGAHKNAFGAMDAGGASVAIEAVNSIPLQHQGPQNPLASDTDSQVPQERAKPVDRVKAEKPPPDAIALKSPIPKKTPAEEASEKTKFRNYKDLDLYQVYSKSAPAVSNPAFAAKAGAGNVNPGANSTLGNRCPGYAAQIQQLVAARWNTSSVDASIHTAPTIIATFDLSSDGTAHNVRIVKGSRIDSLDSSVERAIMDVSPFPKISPECGVDHASAEFWFELKR
jgi:outer membrane biosynthesis protein TonB